MLKRVEAVWKMSMAAGGNSHWVLLNKGRPALVGLETGAQESLKSLGIDWEPEEPENGQKLAQIVVNLLDFVHPR
jgi:hypothetical protein